MIVTCPDCGTRYRIDDAAFSGGGRAVRCNHCSFEWYQIGPTTVSGGASSPSALDLNAAQRADTMEEATFESATRMAAGDNADSSIRETDVSGAKSDYVRSDYAAASYAAKDEFAVDDLSEDELVGQDYITQEDVANEFAPGREMMNHAREPGDTEPLGDPNPSFSTENAAATETSAAEPTSPETRTGASGFSHSVPVVVDANDVRAMGSATRQGRSAIQRKRSALSGVLVGVFAIAVLAPIMFYYLGPEVAEQAPMASKTVEAYRKQVDSVFTATSASSPNEGLVLVTKEYDLVERAEGPALEVWGRVANNGPEVAPSPAIEIVSRDEKGVELQRWLAQLDAEQLDPGESARFQSRMMYPIGKVFYVDLAIVRP